MTLLRYAREQRAQKLARIEALETGDLQLFETMEGITTETTAEQLAKLKSEVAEIRQVLIDEGIAVDE